MTSRLFRIHSILLGCFLLTGCGEGGPQLVPAGGTVKYKGEPVSGASVSFIFGDGQMAAGTTDASGKFTLATGAKNGAPLGAAKVVVSKSSGGMSGTPGKQLTSKDMTDMMKGKAAKDMKTEAPKDELPVKYAKPDTSGLSFTVSAESKDFNIELTD